jgi:hypothetical protein
MSPLNRRLFLRNAAGAAAFAFLAPAARVFAAAPPSDATFRRFAWELTGALVRPGQFRYEEVYPPFNKRYLDIRPAAVALVENVRDVQKCVRFARDYGIPITARAGGHSYAAYCNCPGLVVDFRRMRQINLNTRNATATLQAGARNQDIGLTMTGRRYALPAGRCPSVAVSGLTLGGGFGFSSRKLGLTSDRLISTDIVTADGEFRHCSATENSELFWALRGGGGGNFGINTRFEFQLEPVNRVAVYELAWNFEDASSVLETMQTVIADAPPEFSMRLGMGAVGKSPQEIRASAEISALGQYFGSKAELREVLDPLINAGRTLKVNIDEKGYWEGAKFFYKTAPVNRFAVKSHFVQEPIPAEGFESLINGVQSRPGSSNRLGGGVTFFGWGGRINTVSPTDTAFWHRDAMLLMELDTGWTADDSVIVADANLDWISDLSAEIAPSVSEYSYQNFIDPTLTDWRNAYYGGNYDRLLAAKQQYDPGMLFQFAQGIGT